MELRTWQRDAVEIADRAIQNADRGVIQAIMGAGKSVAIAELVARALRRGEHVVVTVPTQNLVRQLASTIEWWTGQACGQWYADHKELWPATVVCHPSLAAYEAGYQTKYPPTNRLWIADECHRTECDTVLDWNAPLYRIGFTATPYRSELSKSISSFDQILFEYGAEDAYRDGHVVKPTLCHPRATGDVDRLVAEWIHRQEGGGVVNASSIADAERFAKRLGPRAGVVTSTSEHGADKARKVIARGGIVVYVDMLAEGFDCPEILWMALRRPVGSRVRFAQEIGRGLRACPQLDKETCRMLDVHDLWGTHSMNWRAALGEIEPDEAVPALKLDWQLEKTGFGGSSTPQPMPPEILGPMRSWIRAERVAAQFAGRIPANKITSTHWRSDPCSRKQLAELDRVMRQLDPRAIDKGTVRRIRAARAGLVDSLSRDPSNMKGALRKGDASDLIDIVRSLYA